MRLCERERARARTIFLFHSSPVLLLLPQFFFSVFLFIFISIGNIHAIRVGMVWMPLAFYILCYLNHTWHRDYVQNSFSLSLLHHQLHIYCISIDWLLWCCTRRITCSLIDNLTDVSPIIINNCFSSVYLFCYCYLSYSLVYNLVLLFVDIVDIVVRCFFFLFRVSTSFSHQTKPYNVLSIRWMMIKMFFLIVDSFFFCARSQI